MKYRKIVANKEDVNENRNETKKLEHKKKKEKKHYCKYLLRVQRLTTITTTTAVELRQKRGLLKQ